MHTIDAYLSMLLNKMRRWVDAISLSFLLLRRNPRNITGMSRGGLKGKGREEGVGGKGKLPGFGKQRARGRGRIHIDRSGKGK